MKSFITHGGKEIQLFICPKTAHIRIKFIPGGELPEELTGLYTSEHFAELDINRYLDKTKNRKKKDGENNC